MPTPTREQFEAAKQLVIQAAPPGLSKDEFFALIDKELAKTEGPKKWGRRGMDPSTFHGGDPVEGEELIDTSQPRPFKDKLTQSLSELDPMPRSGMDVAGLLTAGQAILPMKAASAIAPVVEGAGKGLYKAGKLAAPASATLAVTDAITRGKLGEAATIATAPYAAQGVGSILRRTGKWMRGPEEVAAEAAPAIAPVTEAVAPALAQAPARVGPPPRLVKNSGGSLEDALATALDEVRQAPEAPPSRTTLPPEPSHTPSGPTAQTGTFKRSEKLGQAKGYSSGRPSTRAADWVEPVPSHAPQAGGGTALEGESHPLTVTPTPSAPASILERAGAKPGSLTPDYMKVQPEEFHTGDPKAQSLHQEDARMDMDYRNRRQPMPNQALGADRGLTLEMLLAALAGTGVGAAPSHQTTR